MHRLPGYKDIEDLKWQIAKDAAITKQLAFLAHSLGFGWCGGTQSANVGENFDVTKSGDNYVLQAHYGSGDSHAGGYAADKRLRITLSNFRIGFDPSKFHYSTPVIKSLQPATVATFPAQNEGATEDTITKTITFQLTETVTHTTNYSFTEGIKVSVKWTNKIPFFGGGEVSTELNFSATQGWSDATSTANSIQDTSTYSAKIPARSQRMVRVVASRTSSDVSYTGLAVVDFDIEFYGFLRWGGNARSDHPTDRPFVTLKFGNDKMGGLEDIADKWAHRDISGYWGWDWQWMRDHGYGGLVDSAVKFCSHGVGAPVSGKFNDVKGTHVAVVADDPQPLPAASAKPDASSPYHAAFFARLPLGHGVAAAATAAAIHHSLGEHPATLLHSDEIPGARVVSIK